MGNFGNRTYFRYVFIVIYPMYICSGRGRKILCSPKYYWIPDIRMTRLKNRDLFRCVKGQTTTRKSKKNPGVIIWIKKFQIKHLLLIMFKKEFRGFCFCFRSWTIKSKTIVNWLDKRVWLWSQHMKWKQCRHLEVHCLESVGHVSCDKFTYIFEYRALHGIEMNNWRTTVAQIFSFIPSKSKINSGILILFHNDRCRLNPYTNFGCQLKT